MVDAGHFAGLPCFMPSILLLDRSDPGMPELMDRLQPGVPASLISVTIEPGREEAGIMSCEVTGVEYDEDELSQEVKARAVERTDLNEGQFDQGQTAL